MKRIRLVKEKGKGVKEMKKITLLALAAFVLLGASIGYAATSSNVGVTAAVPNQSPELTMVIKELTQPNQNPWTGTTVTSMSFGQLTHTLADGSEAGVWYSPKYYCVFIFTTSFGHQYEVRSTCNGLVSGGTQAPAGAFGLTPAYAAEDEWSPGVPQGARPTGSTLGTAGPAVATNKVIYRSEAAATNRIIRAFYSIPSYGAGGALPYTGYQPIPLSQPAGTYSATVTISIVAI